MSDILGDTRNRQRSTRALQALIGAALVTLILYFVPFGNYALYPLMLFSTFAHEAGHGLAAVLVGNEFVSFRMWADGSGVAQHRGVTNAAERAFISAGGLLGPAVLGALFFIIGRRASLARLTLYAFALACLVAEVLVVRNLFGLTFVGLVAALSGVIAHRASPAFCQFCVVFLAIQLSLSAFSRSDYLFVEYANTTGGRLPSDTTQMALALGGPYWLWGALVGALSVLVLILGMWVFVRSLRH